MVTVNEANKNLIVWERPEVQTIAHFNKYKESIEFGYLLLGTGQPVPDRHPAKYNNHLYGQGPPGRIP